MSSIVKAISKLWVSAFVSGVLMTSAAHANDLENRYQASVDLLAKEGERNLVLNHMNAASLAIMLQNFEAAEQHLDEALLRIEAIYSGDAKSTKARSLWYAEGSKDFRGEPYERAMAYYYRGILDLIKGEYDNARASFKGGLLQDAFAEEEQNRSDFASLLFLEGWTLQAEGRPKDAAEAWQELGNLGRDSSLPKPNHNLLIIVETGKSPRKMNDGVAQNIMVYRRGKRFNDVGARIKGLNVTLKPMEDVFYQASTRGGRQIDKILNGKAEYRNSSDRVGDQLGSLSSTAQTVDSVIGNGSAGAAIAGVGVLAGVWQLAGSRVNATADTRYWSTLPDTIHMATTSLKGDQLPPVQILDSQGNVLDIPVVGRLFKDTKGNYVYWARTFSTIEK